MLPIVAQVGASSIGLQFTNPVTAPATQPLQPSPNAPVDQSVVMADFARRLRGLEQAIKLQVPNDRILSAIALTTDAALISSNKVAIVGEVTFADWHRDVSGNPSGTLDPGITQIRGGVIRTGMIENLAATAWVNLDASGSTNFLQCGSAVAVGANGHFTFGDAAVGKQFIFDGSSAGLGGGVINLQTGSTLSAIESNATYGATRTVGDITASILASSGTAITVTSSTLFSMPGSGSAGTFIGAGGIVGKNSSGATTFALESATGLITAAAIKAGSSLGLQSNSTTSARLSFFNSSGSEVAYIQGNHNAFAYNGPELVGFQVFSNNSDESSGIERYAVANSSGAALNSALLGGQAASSFAPLIHTHWLWDIYPSTAASTKFRYSLDGSTWQNIYMQRTDW